jgi:hypothetical protein
VEGLDGRPEAATPWRQRVAYSDGLGRDDLPATVADVLPLESTLFVYVVGTIEILAGPSLLTRYADHGAYVIAAWLFAVAGTLVVAGSYDVAVRDVVMAVGAMALAQRFAADVSS